MTPDITRITLGELISDPDTVVQRHAHGIVKRLRARQGVDIEAPAEAPDPFFKDRCECNMPWTISASYPHERTSRCPAKKK